MKIRVGHVSNSSSSSFAILFPSSLWGAEIRENTYRLIEQFQNEHKWSETDKWDVNNDTAHNVIWCSADMDNIDLYGFCVDTLKIPETWVRKEY